MKKSDTLEEILEYLEMQLRIYHSVLNMAVTLLEKHAPHTIMVFETVLETVDETIGKIRAKIHPKPTRKSRKQGGTYEKE